MFGERILTKTEQKHLKENKIDTKYQFLEQIKFLKETREKYPEWPYPCYDCVHIAKKLGVWES